MDKKPADQSEQKERIVPVKKEDLGKIGGGVGSPPPTTSPTPSPGPGGP